METNWDLPCLVSHPPADSHRSPKSLSSILTLLHCIVGSSLAYSADFPGTQASDFPQFVVPGQEAVMTRVQELFRLHHGRAFTACTLWDAWLPHATLWAAIGAPPSAQKARDYYRGVFLTRRIDEEGYVSMQQHRGMAHSDGWPFPAWQQAGGAGWHFSTLHEPWAIQNFNLQALTSTKGWDVNGAEVEGIDPATGLKLRATGDVVTLTTPAFSCGTIVAPFARIEWAAQGLSRESRPSVSWQYQGETEWKPDRRALFPPLSDQEGLQYANVPLYKQPGYGGLLTRLRLTIDHAAGAKLTLKSLITSIDTRHPITNSNFVRGSAEYFAWTNDLPFLRQNIGRMRRTLRYAIAEFGVRENNLVHVPWVGHDGRSGLELKPDGTKKIHVGLGVGNNYWDLLPFGHHDVLATIYCYDALRRMTTLEREIAAHPDWSVSADGEPLRADDLTQLADAAKKHASSYFWDAELGRFVGWIDATGRRRDYGFTFVNIEAIYYGLATDEQARSIYDWLDGRRTIAGDTSQGTDIYHWRFAPRATTRRNVECYVWPWSGPETIPWGGQVQDGGAVLGFTYFDLMARLRTFGPDNAWNRLREVLQWFGEVQAEGGYRAYYAKPGRGTLQGGGPPGGLGLDHEFLESVLVPQMMLYGFLGCEPRAGGLSLSPRLPADWPSLAITQVQTRGHVFDITATRDEVRLTARAADDSEFKLWLPAGRWEMSVNDAKGEAIGAATRHVVGASGEPLRIRLAVGHTCRCARQAADWP